MLSAEERTRGKEKKCCYECGKSSLGGEDHGSIQVNDSPWGPPKETKIHADLNGKRNDEIVCKKSPIVASSLSNLFPGNDIDTDGRRANKKVV